MIGGSTFLANGYPEHDKVGNIKTRTGNFPASYLYDNLYRLEEAQTTFGTEKFTYDDVGNRESGPGPRDTNYEHDAANRMTKGRQYSYTYDNYGNQTGRTTSNQDKSMTLTWDYENRLAGMERTKGAEKRTVTFKYDPFGRRIEKKLVTIIDDATRTTTTTYVYDVEDIVLEIVSDGATAITTRYIHGPGIDEPLALERNGQHYFYHQDGLGSVTAISDGSNVVQRYSYDSFGNPRVTTPFHNSYQFTGREWDKETGLYYYRARYYDPVEGRFISRDPIAFKGGDVLLYGYVGNNAANESDPKGLSGASGSWSNGNITSGYGWNDGICSNGAGVFNLSKCTRQCCKKHDDCYQRNGCNASSWISNLLPIMGDGTSCEKCNIEAMACIIKNIGKTSCDDCRSGDW